MNYLIEIKEVKTGDIALYKWHCKPEYDDGQRFWWEKGNGSCDCNRGDFFREAAGITQQDSECGDDKYRIRVTDETGVVTYSEL